MRFKDDVGSDGPLILHCANLKGQN
jgi:hypothetical protein